MTKTETMSTGKTILITGGASFIGSTLADRLIERGARIRVVDDLTSGHLGNISGHIASGNAEFIRADLREPGIARGAVQGVHTVFHLAADHGGRGYVDFAPGGTGVEFFSRRLDLLGSCQSQSSEGTICLIRLRLSEFPPVRRSQGNVSHRGFDQGPQ